MLSAEFEPPPDFRPEAFADLPPPPPDELVYYDRPYYAFDDFGPPPPPPPAQYVYVEDDDWRDLPPPPPPAEIGLLPVLGVAIPIAIGAVAFQHGFHHDGIAPRGQPRLRSAAVRAAAAPRQHQTGSAASAGRCRGRSCGQRGCRQAAQADRTTRPARRARGSSRQTRWRAPGGCADPANCLRRPQLLPSRAKRPSRFRFRQRRAISPPLRFRLKRRSLPRLCRLLQAESPCRPRRRPPLQRQTSRAASPCQRQERRLRPPLRRSFRAGNPLPAVPGGKPLPTPGAPPAAAVAPVVPGGKPLSAPIAPPAAAVAPVAPIAPVGKPATPSVNVGKPAPLPTAPPATATTPVVPGGKPLPAAASPAAKAPATPASNLARQARNCRGSSRSGSSAACGSRPGAGSRHRGAAAGSRGDARPPGACDRGACRAASYAAGSSRPCAPTAGGPRASAARHRWFTRLRRPHAPVVRQPPVGQPQACGRPGLPPCPK